jgi:hypothetical protein
VDIEHQESVSWDVSGASWSISVLRWAKKESSVTKSHSRESIVPASDGSAGSDLECEWLSLLHAGVEDLSVKELTSVVDSDFVASSNLGVFSWCWCKDISTKSSLVDFGVLWQGFTDLELLGRFPARCFSIENGDVKLKDRVGWDITGLLVSVS